MTTRDRARRLLLIGGCGYVGSALYRHLLGRGYVVDTVDLEWYGNGVNPRNRSCDVAALTREEVSTYRSVVLLAGHSGPNMCGSLRSSVFRNNVGNFLALLDKLDESQRFLYASSASVYGRTDGADATEDWVGFSPICYYDLSKSEIDAYATLSGLEAYGLRFGTVNGSAPHVRGDLMINRMVDFARRAGAISVTNPEASRPILGTADLCRAVSAILEAEDPLPGLYNLASFNLTVGEIGERAARSLGCDLALASPSPSYDMRMSTAKFERAFAFRFQDTVESIVESLVQGGGRERWTVRTEAKAYD